MTASNTETCQQMVENDDEKCRGISNCYSICSNHNNISYKDQQESTIKTKSSKASTFHSNIPTLNWLDTLEKDFDKNFVDLDLLLGDFDGNQMVNYFNTRGKKYFKLIEF